MHIRKHDELDALPSSSMYGINGDDSESLDAKAKARLKILIMELESELGIEDKFEKIKLVPHQVMPDGNWFLWMMLGGRGAGKTFAGAYYTIKHLRKYGSKAWVNIGAKTFADIRNTVLEGESGLVTLWCDEFETYNKANNTLIHRDSGRVTCISASEPDRWRGPQCSMLWCDELATWPKESWDNAILGLRIGENPFVIATTTPRPTPLMRALLEKESTVVTRGSTFDNLHLSEKALDVYKETFGNTRLGRQELDGEMLEDLEGAMWRQEWINNNRVDVAPDPVKRILYIDPAVTSNETSDETGMAVCQKSMDGNYHLLFSAGVILSPNAWAKYAVKIFHDFNCDEIVAEKNQGGEMVKFTLQTVWRDAPVRLVTSYKSKMQDAIPVASLSEQGRVKYVGHHPELENQLLTIAFDNNGKQIGSERIDRFDSFVRGIKSLMDESDVWSMYLRAKRKEKEATA